MSYRIYCLVLLATVKYVSSQEPVVVNTVYGSVQGYTDNAEGKPYSAFLGIPYAKPPTGERRFRPPERLDNWNDVRPATAFGPACPQQPSALYTIDEDCLYLDVFVPGNVTENVASPLPVMVYIPGGGLVSGTTLWYHGKYFTTQAEPVVLVVMHYRLGILGFLTTGDDEVPGNLGLKDQVFALHWVQENIARFGGDKSKVTILGESAGADSVMLHLFSPMSAGLFHRAIAESPSGPLKHSSKEHYKGAYYDLVGLDCEPSQFVQCLRALNWTDLLLLPQQFMFRAYVIDGEFLTQAPWQPFRAERVNPVDLIIGFTNDDGEVIQRFFPEVRDVFTNGVSSHDVINFLLVTTLRGQLSDGTDILDGRQPVLRQSGRALSNIQDLLAVLRGKYIPGDPVLNARGLLDALRDSLFVTYALHAAAHISSAGGSVRVYTFEHRSEYLGTSTPVPLYSPHVHEWVYLFNNDPGTLTQDEKQLSSSILTAWTSFATDGQVKFLSMNNTKLDWPKFAQDRTHVVFDTNMSERSIQQLDNTWQPIADFWLAVQSFGSFEQEERGGADDDNDDDSSAEFKSSLLKMDEDQADAAVIGLLCVCCLLLVCACVLACRTCGGSRKSEYAI